MTGATVAAANEQTYWDVGHVGGPEGKQEEHFAVRIYIFVSPCLLVVGFIDQVDPHIT